MASWQPQDRSQTKHLEIPPYWVILTHAHDRIARGSRTWRSAAAVSPSRGPRDFAVGALTAGTAQRVAHGPAERHRRGKGPWQRDVEAARWLKL